MKNLTETWYNELLPGFSKLVMNEKTLSESCWWGWTYIYSHVQLTETRQYTYKAAFGNLIHSTQAAYWKKTHQYSYSNVSKPEQNSGLVFI
jgi:hypothetical protein